MTRDQIRASISHQTALVATLLGEAASEPLAGQVAVACVIRNRVNHPRWWGRTYREVCHAKSQFTCWWEDNANTDRVYALAEALARSTAATGPYSVVGQLQWVAQGVMGDVLIDETRFADHYLTAALFNSAACPSWAKGKVPVAVIGSHVFLRLEI